MTFLSSLMTPRRSFLQQLAVGTAAVVGGGWVGVREASAARPGRADDLALDEWLDRIRGKHKQVFDCVTANDGFGPVFALTYIDSFTKAHPEAARDITGVVVMRHFAMPLTLNDATWEKYKVGELIGVTDPTTKAPATRNIFRANIPFHTGLTYEAMVANQPVIMTACNVALTVLSGMAGGKVGISADEAKRDWTAGVLPGVVVVPSGVYAVNRAQERGCTYCYGG